MKRHFLLIVCLLTLLSDRAIAEKAPKAVQAGVDDILKRHSMPGGVAAIVENGRVSLIVASGFRKHGDTKPFTVDDKVHIGSCTKAMTATQVGMLIDEGKLGWDTKITDVFPEFAEQLHEDYRPVTISQLLSHRRRLEPIRFPASWNSQAEEAFAKAGNISASADAPVSVRSSDCPGSESVWIRLDQH